MNITVEYIVNGSAAWIDESESNRADCVVKFSHLSEEVPFTADSSDAEFNSHAGVVLQAIKDGDAGAVKSYAAWKAERDAEEAAAAGE